MKRRISFMKVFRILLSILLILVLLAGIFVFCISFESFLTGVGFLCFFIAAPKFHIARRAAAYAASHPARPAPMTLILGVIGHFLVHRVFSLISARFVAADQKLLALSL